MSYQGFVIWAILHFQSKYERFIMTLGKCVVSEAWFLETNIPKYDLKWFVLWGMSCNLSVNSPKIFLGVDMICHIYYIYFWNTKICTFFETLLSDLIRFIFSKSINKLRLNEPWMFKQNLFFVGIKNNSFPSKALSPTF